MKITDLDGKQHSLSLAGYSVDGSETRPRSELHIKARKLIKEAYPLYQILEEVSIPIKKGTTNYLDFFLPQPRICIEINGRQHFEFVNYFHGNLAGFRLQQKKDRLKREWLTLNNIKYIDLNYNESEEEWQTKIKIRK
jgi:hypothetical protein